MLSHKPVNVPNKQKRIQQEIEMPSTKMVNKTFHT